MNRKLASSFVLALSLTSVASADPTRNIDLTVFDPTREWVVDASRFRTKGRNTPYAGRTLRGKAVCTVVGGRVVYRES